MDAALMEKLPACLFIQVMEATTNHSLASVTQFMEAGDNPAFSYVQWNGSRGCGGRSPPPDVSTALEFDTKSLLLSSPAERDFP